MVAEDQMRTIIAMLALAVAAETPIAEAGADKPNVAIIFNNDQGDQDLGCFGSPDIDTPRVDQMA